MKGFKLKFSKLLIIFAAFVFMGGGFFVLFKSQNEVYAAETISSTQTDSSNWIEKTLEKREYINNDKNEQIINNKSLIGDDIFMFFNDSSALNLSFKTNEMKDDNVEYTNNLYNFVNHTSATTFNFYTGIVFELYINGNRKTPADTHVVSHGNFKNLPSLNVETFSINFVKTAAKPDDFSIFKNNQIIEGLYTLKFTLVYVTCTIDPNNEDYKGEIDEDTDWFSSEEIQFTYNFNVVARENYFETNLPNLSYENFDKTATYPSETSTVGFELNSNFTSKGAVNKIPNISFNSNRFEANISKLFSSTTTYATISTNKTTKEVEVDGDIVKVTNNESTCTVFFTDVGVYTVTLKPINIAEFCEGINEETNQPIRVNKKYILSGMDRITKRTTVTMFGYQLNNTDFNSAPNENNERDDVEMKTYDLTTKTFVESADITSGFINSNPAYSQGTDDNGENNSFLGINIINYIENRNIMPVSTNQTPLKFITNATPLASDSRNLNCYVLSTNNLTGSKEYAYTLNGTKLYQKAFNGSVENAVGTYIYVISYKCAFAGSETYYQVFYFSIDKGNPTINVETENGEDVTSNMFTNQSVVVIDSTLKEHFNKAVTVQIYAYNYSATPKTYFSLSTGLSGTDAENGVSMAALIENGGVSNVYDIVDGEDGYKNLLLLASAKYIIRLYYTSDLANTSTNINSTTNIISEQEFTIDKNEIGAVTGRNVRETADGDYQILNDITSFSTNQSFTLSWAKKSSGATSKAYYRYFPLVSTPYYSSSASNNTLISMLLSQEVMAVDYVIDMTKNNKWIEVAKNSITGGNTVNVQDGSTITDDFVFNSTQAGLYLIQIEDQAGNNTYTCFLIDPSTPYFAIFNNNAYSIPSSSLYINQSSALYWGNYKGIFMKGFDSSVYDASVAVSDVTQSTLNSLSNRNMYVDRNGNTSTDIYQMLHRMWTNKALQNLTFDPNYISIANDVTDGGYISSYTNMYMTISINKTSFYMDELTTSGEYKTLDNDANCFKVVIGEIEDSSQLSQKVHKIFLGADSENTIKILLRDASNTKQDLSFSPTALLQYTNFFSSRQVLKISYDDSQFKLTYQNDRNETEELYSFISDAQADHSLKTEYFSPTNLNTKFTVSFIPTSTTDETVDGTPTTKTIQVESLTVRYFKYSQKSQTVNGTTYFYNAFDDSPTYQYSISIPEGKKYEYDIGVSNSITTSPGKYEITRTYATSSGFTYNAKDYLSRTFVLLVDRYNVVSSPETTADGHSESLVGGDIFFAMFDSGNNSNLVVTFPNSEEGNTSGVSTYGNKHTTNKLPVNIYVPQYKYTTYVTKTEQTDNSYNFDVNFNFNDTLENSNTMNFHNTTTVIQEYLLYAQLYRGEGMLTTSNLIATSVKDNISNPTISDIKNSAVNGNGFLTFYDLKGEKFGSITTAGKYTLRVVQGFASEYQSEFIFEFTIESATPDFTAQLVDGSSLKSTTQTISNTPTQVYHTNQQQVSLLWNIPTDTTYMVQIDVNEITLVTSTGRTYTTRKGENGSLIDAQIWESVPTKQSNHTYLATLNLKKLDGVYQNGGWVNITMQFENHDSAKKSDGTNAYSKITKRIYVDLSAPSENVEALVARTLKNTQIKSMTQNLLRTHLTAENETATDLDNTSYNLSNGNEENPFAYYSYTVSSSYLATLQAQESEDHKTYIRKFTDKYVSGKPQETTPKLFTANGFSEIKGDGQNVISSLEIGSYYEVVETDLAGNMSIFTIFVANDEQTTPLLSFTGSSTGNGYTLEEYNEVKSFSGAIHNIFSQTGFVLSDINFFGDAWAQFTLETYDARHIPTTRTLMLSPSYPGYALSFSSGNVTTPISISSLINGTISTQYKNVLSILNSQTGEMEKFYINIRNTTFSGTLTNQQALEYISFNRVTDAEIQDPEFAYTFLKSLKIEVDGIEYYGDKDKTSNLGYASSFSSNAYVTVDKPENEKTITFLLNNNVGFTAGSKVVYTFTDNYGKQYKEIHIYQESVISREVSSVNDLYSYADENDNTIYITSNDLEFTFNRNKYNISIFDVAKNGTISNELTRAKTSTRTNTNNTQTVTISTIVDDANEDGFMDENYDDMFVIVINDSDGEFVKNIYFKLYNELPNPIWNKDSSGDFSITDANSNNITSKILKETSSDETGYFSEVSVYFSNTETFIPVVYSVSTDMKNWTQIVSGTQLRASGNEMEKWFLKVWYDETYLENLDNTAKYVFENVPETQIYEFYLSALTATYWVEKTINGITTIVEKASTPFTAPDGTKYTNHYIVNVDYGSRSTISIKVNKEQEISAGDRPTKIFQGEHIYDGSATIVYQAGNVYSELWVVSNNKDSTSNIAAFSAKIVITYIPASSNFVKQFYTQNIYGVLETDKNLITKTSTKVVVPQDYSNVEKIMLQWSRYYGLQENEIHIKLVKDGVQLSPTIYSTMNGDNKYFYTYLTLSGKYTISLYDEAGNVQTFSSGTTGQSEIFTFTFLKDVPFTVTYTNLDGEEETSLPIKQAVYNSAVTLKIDPTTRSEFYAVAGLENHSGYPTISVKKNGVAYTKEFASNETNFQFDEEGYYEVTFSATALDENNSPVMLREETYAFTIINAKENKISYVFNQYSNYYIEAVFKNGKDITADLIKTLDVSTTILDGIRYLTRLPISYLDEKTGVGEYTITINTNNSLLAESSLPTKFTYKLNINRGQAPLDISIGEGKSTTSNIRVSYNSANVYAEMGECILQILYLNNKNELTVAGSVAITSESTNTGTLTITNTGSYFVQIVSPSGLLLFSYKVIKSEPMNAATIIIIVVAVVLLVIVIFIIIKLRKRISVK